MMPLTNTTPFPNHLLDRVMPVLTDTQWRVLCVVVRQTLGWQHPRHQGRRKTSDWLTLRQLQRRTHRGHTAVSRAVAALVQRGLLMVTGANGQPLTTPARRRSYSGPLFYRLSDTVLATVFEEASPGNRPGDRQTSQSGQPTPQSGEHSPQSGVHKVETTKETLHKISPNGGRTINHRLLTARNSDQSNPDVKRFLRTYINLFKEHSTRGEPPIISWGKDGAVVKQLLRVYPYTRLVELLNQFFAANDDWIRQRGYSLGAFRAAISQLLVNERISTVYRRDPQSGQWVKEREERV